jgi:hypothetical protein
MAHRVAWVPEAVEDIEDIAAYVECDSNLFLLTECRFSILNQFQLLAKDWGTKY